MKRSLIITIICLYAIAIAVVSASGQTENDSIPTLPAPEPLELCPSSPLPPPITSYTEYFTSIGAGTTYCPNGFDESTFKLVSEVSDGNTCPVTIVRTYQIEDKCGMKATVEHVFVKNDYNRPVFNFPTIIEIYSLDEVNEYPIFKSLDEFVNHGGIAFDNCAIDPSTFKYIGDSPLEGTECDGMIRRRYSVEDYCGNLATAEVIFRIYAEMPTQLRCPPDANVECFISEPPITDPQVMVDLGYLQSTADIDLNSLTHTDDVSKTPEGTIILRTYTIRDICGNESSCTQRIFVRDIEPPVLIARDLNIYLDETGIYTVDLYDILESVSEKCTPVNRLPISAVLPTLGCNDVGKVIQVEITASDDIGNKSEPVYSNITVLDQVPPEALCRDITVYLDENGTASITPAYIDDGSTDNCQIVSMTLDRTAFNCNDVGQNTVKMKVADASGNQDECTAMVTVIDTIAPVAICQSIEIHLGPNGRANLSPTMVDSGSYDNCGVPSLDIDPGFLTCDNIGENIVTLYVTDRFGNVSSCQTIVNVWGNTPPVAKEDTVNVMMNEFTLIQVLLNDYDPNGAIDPKTVWIATPPAHGSLTVDAAGGVTYKPFDNYTGTDSFSYRVCDDGLPCGEECDEATVFIEVKADNESPVIYGMLQAMQFECLTEVPVPFSSLYELAEAGITVTDDFAIDSTSFHVSEMAFNDNCIITLVRQYTISDLAQNSATIEQTFVIEDTQDPILKCPPNVVLSLDHPLPGKFTTLDSFVAQGGSVADNCEIDSGSFFNMSESIDTLSNSILIRRAYYVEDYCRNGDICLHQIEIETETNSIGIPDVSDFQISVYPNPSNGQFSVKVEVSQPSDVQFEIVDMNGKTIYTDNYPCTTGTNLKEISLQNIAPGTYMLKAKSGRDVVIEKVVVR